LHREKRLPDPASAGSLSLTSRVPELAATPMPTTPENQAKLTPTEKQEFVKAVLDLKAEK
jgi:hypothetical protein